MALTPIADRRSEETRPKELLFSGPSILGSPKACSSAASPGQFLFPYPQLQGDEKARVDRAVADIKRFAAEQIDAAAIDRNATFRQASFRGLVNSEFLA